MMVNIRLVTQLLCGLMLFFGVLTLFPKAMMLLREGRRPKAVLYFFLGSMAAFFSVMSFYYAWLTY